MKHNLKYKIVLGITSTVFCIGFLVSIVDGYYGYNYSHFIDIGRQDLIARLGFLSWTTGFIYYPLCIVIIALTSLLLKRTKTNIISKQWIYLICPTFLVGLLFYTHSIDFLMIADIRFWWIGLILMGMSILTYPILLRSRKKTEHNKELS